MNITIFSLYKPDYSLFTSNADSVKYVTEQKIDDPRYTDVTDLSIQCKSFKVDSKHIEIVFPNNKPAYFKIPENRYWRIEVV